jgi:methylglutaconyl-CoA hydratase
MVNQNHGSPGCNGEARLVSLETDKCAMRPPKLVQKNDSTKEAESKAEIQAENPNISTSLAKSFSTGSSTCTRNKENDGFVTTRKNSCKRSNDENSWKKPEKTLLQCSTSTGAVPLACEKNGVAKRKALTEATNLQQSNVMEITGKWQCPQKRKPDRGPALKQLRLERWVHKVGNISPH